VSLIKGEKGTISNSTINAATWQNGSLSNSNIYQGIFLEVGSTGCTFQSKYDDDYLSLKRFVTDDGLVVNQNNYTFGYNFVGFSGKTATSAVINSNIENGNFYKCNITSDITRTISNGFFIDCTVSNYNLKNIHHL
jgi:hypothetical protein